MMFFQRLALTKFINSIVSSKRVKLVLGCGKFFCFYYCLTEYCVEVVFCIGPSMEPTILSNDVVLAEHISVFRRKIHRNDVVICRSPSQPAHLVCKRVIGIEGDLIHESIFQDSSVPNGHIWLEGDNRSNSTDSWSYGPVPSGLVRSRVLMRLWPNPSLLTNNGPRMQPESNRSWLTDSWNRFFGVSRND